MIAAPPVARAPIRRLDPATVGRIAAGEVVERPASVVKELLENAVDAGATKVTVRLRGGGLGRIEVEDDGRGIPAAELELAVERHATSKLDPSGPIERIETLGFRGEALAAIAAVAWLRLLSRPPESEVGEGIEVMGGGPAGRFSGSRATGTTVDVADLFFNTPARRKFLKSPPAEQLEVVRTVERAYLARPSVAIRVEAEGQEVASYPATTDLRDAAARVLGPDFLAASFVVDAPVPGGRARGVLGRPSAAAAGPGGLYFAVNGRPIVSRSLAQSVRVAFGDYLPRSRFPVGLLHLDLDGDRLDVNVHPTKREVRIARERDTEDAVRRAVRIALTAAPQVAELPDRVGPPVPPSWGREDAAGPAGGRRPLVPGVQRTLSPPSADAPTAGATIARSGGHPPLTLLGCLDDLYWVGASDGGLVLVDQHAASERVVYETLRRAGTLARQELVEPIVVRLSGVQRSALTAHGDSVRAAGFDVEPFGPEQFRVRSVPSYRGRRATSAGVVALLDELSAGGRPTLPDGLEERTAASIACHAAIRAGDVVDRDEMARVLAALYALPEAAYACPHGRPILLRIPRTRLDRWFLRSGA